MYHLFNTCPPPRPWAPKEVIQGLQRYQQELDEKANALAHGQAITRRYLADMESLLGEKPEQEPEAASAPASAERSFLVGSLFLYDCHRYLTQREPEWLHYVTGLQVQGAQTLDRMVTFKLEQQSAGYVKGDPAATRDALFDLQEFGHVLGAAFHSHRMRGPRSVTPSDIDKRHQERLERGGYHAVSGIFSDDGYIRFFTVKEPFGIQTYGKGVEHVEEHLFKLTTVA